MPMPKRKNKQKKIRKIRINKKIFQMAKKNRKIMVIRKIKTSKNKNKSKNRKITI